MLGASVRKMKTLLVQVETVMLFGNSRLNLACCVY